jgi:hypothetical protein
MTIEELEAALAERDAKIAGLEAELERHRPPPPPKPVLDGPFQMPDASQCSALLAIIHRRYPAVERVAERLDDALGEFQQALRWLGTGPVWVADALDAKRSTATWCDLASDRNMRVTLPSFVAAVIASLEIAYAHMTTYPYDQAYALVEGGPRAGSWRLRNGWLRTLDGHIRESILLTRPKQSESRELRESMVRQLGGGGW